MTLIIFILENPMENPKMDDDWGSPMTLIIFILENPMENPKMDDDWG